MKLTTSEAWTLLAEAWRHPVQVYCHVHDSYVAQVLGRAFYGLCGALAFLRSRSLITELQWFVMLDSVRMQGTRMGRPYGEFIWPTTIEGAKLRAAFCRRTAEATK